MRGLRHSKDPLQDAVQILQHVTIPESKYVNAETFEHHRPMSVVRSLRSAGVAAPVELDCEPSVVAIEVEDVATDWMLPAKLHTGKATVAENPPKKGLGIC